MSRVADLLADLAPDGVRFESLGEIGEFIRGNGLQKSDLTEQGAPAIHYGEIHTYYGTWATTTRSFIDPALAGKLRRAKPGDLVIATTSEDDAAVAKATAWIGDDEVAVSGDAYIFRHSLDPRYIAYTFQSDRFQMQKAKHVTGTKVRRISGDSLAKIRVPVPPLEVQAEIVRTLDRFSALEGELEFNLEEELRARSQQLDYYTPALLRPTGSSVRTVRIGEVADVLVGYSFKSVQFSEDPAAPALVRGDNIGQGALKDREFKRWTRFPGDQLEPYELAEGDLVVAMDRPWIPAGLKWAPIPAAALPALLVQRVARLRANPAALDQRYLACLIGSPLFTDHILSSQAGNTVPHITRSHIAEFVFALPDLVQQSQIASSVERFGRTSRGLQADLRAEFEARRRQYAYYREKLLTFEAAAR